MLKILENIQIVYCNAVMFTLNKKPLTNPSVPRITFHLQRIPGQWRK